MDPFPTLISPCPLVFLSNLSNIDEVAFLANLGKASLAKRTAKSSYDFFCLNYLSDYLTFYQEIKITFYVEWR